jgi:hypothetical protein
MTRREVFSRLVVAFGVLVACTRQDVRPSTYTGVVIDMQVASFVKIATFTLRTDDGTTVDMVAGEGDIGITAGHLREHMVLGEAVLVTVRYDGDTIVALKVDDAPPQ